MNDSSFLEELQQIVVRRAAAMHLVDTMAFASEVAERLEDDPVFGEYIQVEYSGLGSRNRQIRVHGFTDLDESDGSVGLVICKWTESEEPETLTTAMVTQLSSWLENFVRESIENGLNERIAEASPAYDLATKLREQRHKISRIRLHIVSNQSLSQKFKEELCGEVAGIPMERHIWDLQRLKALYESTREREAVEIDLTHFGAEGIPCLEAARTDGLRSYLCIIEGQLLADLFERYGSRLLEGNVRSFLGLKGTVNKNIRATIQDTPALFFAYNNGIAATASSVTVKNFGGRQLVTNLLDLQIVNGGQTTASILNARKKDGLLLEGITVQMKLTEVDQAMANDLIPKIAQFANTQNKVAIADFFANHPFHRKIEEISRRMQVPAKAGARIQSKWFYERARGQFQNERLYLSKSKKDAFDLEYPAEQVINKTELAKYDNTWREYPHWVSLGAQKNFTKFANQFSSLNPDTTESEHWATISPKFGESYYQQIVAVAILWKRTEDIVSAGKGDWYEGGYRPQIVAYTLSLIFHFLRSSGHEFDLGKLWIHQGIDSSIENFIKGVAIAVQREILSPPQGMTNVGEWSKREACWERVKQISLPAIDRIGQWKVGREEFRKEKIAGRKQGIQDDGIDLQKTVLDLSANGYWMALLKWSKLSETITASDKNLLTRASTIQGFLKINIEKDWRKLLEIKKICEDEGFRKG